MFSFNCEKQIQGSCLILDSVLGPVPFPTKGKILFEEIPKDELKSLMKISIKDIAGRTVASLDSVCDFNVTSDVWPMYRNFLELFFKKPKFNPFSFNLNLYETNSILDSYSLIFSENCMSNTDIECYLSKNGTPLWTQKFMKSCLNNEFISTILFINKQSNSISKYMFEYNKNGFVKNFFVINNNGDISNIFNICDYEDVVVVSIFRERDLPIVQKYFKDQLGDVFACEMWYGTEMFAKRDFNINLEDKSIVVYGKDKNMLINEIKSWVCTYKTKDLEDLQRYSIIVTQNCEENLICKSEIITDSSGLVSCIEYDAENDPNFISRAVLAFMPYNVKALFPLYENGFW